MCIEAAGLVVNSVDPDQTLHFAASDHCLLTTCLFQNLELVQYLLYFCWLQIVIVDS